MQQKMNDYAVKIISWKWLLDHEDRKRLNDV